MTSSHFIRAELSSLDDSGDFQTGSVQGFAGEQLDDVLRVQNFGQSSNPPPGSIGLLASLGGSRERPVIIGMEHDQYRPKGLPVGGKAIYDMHGNVVKLVNGGGIQMASLAGLTLSAGGAMSIAGDGQPCEMRVGTLTIIADKVVIQSGNINLGGEGGARVATEAGFSTTTRAV